MTQDPPRLIAEQFGMAHLLWNAWVLLFIIPLIYFFLAKAYRNTDSTLVRRQILVISFGMAIPIVATVLFVSGVTLIDFTPIGFGALCVLFTVADTRYRVLDVVPIARDAIFKNMDAGVLVLNDDDRIVDVNHQGEAIIGERAEDLLGVPVFEPFDESETVLEVIKNVTDDTRNVALDGENGTRQYQVAVSPIQGTDGRTHGRVIMFSDITEQVEYQRQLVKQNEELERKNERLDQFARIVAHDLQNPLNVATGRLELARTEHESEHLAEVARAHDRMQALIEDLLALARHGQSVSETEVISLATAAQTAWGTVDTREGTLVTATDRQIEADRTRLRQLFENLFVNAIEHGGESVTVTLGYMDDTDGFYVEDDGPGIPEEDQAEVFDPGYSTAADGTGFGLNIVRQAAEAHGWGVHVTNGSDGGARFEFTDIKIAE